MSFPITKASVGITWAAAMTGALWLAIVSGALPAWAAVVFIAVLPPLAMMVMANTPAKSIAQILRDVDSGSDR